MLIYSPLMELYFKHQKTVHDFLLQLGMIIVAILVDTGFFYGLRINLPTVSLFVFVVGYLGARAVIRAKGKQELFGSFANQGPLYCTFLSIWAWIVYFFFVRWARIR